jgi:hypothetical protein
MEMLSRRAENIIRKGMGYIDMPKLDIDEYAVYSRQKEDHKICKIVVREVLENWKPATNNDLLLYLEVLRVLGKCRIEESENSLRITISKDNIPFMPQSESITRARRALNEKGLCLPTDEEVLEHRSSKCKAMKKFLGEEKRNKNK